MRGHVFKRGSSRSYKVELGRHLNGRRVQRSKGGFARRKDAEAALADVLGRHDRGDMLETTRLSVEQFLVEHWLPSLHDLRPNTVLAHSTQVRLHIVPHVGHLP